jgi:hypothetical protein
MTQNEHYGNASAKFPGHRLDIFNLNSLEDFLGRHCAKFNATEQVSAESLEMEAYESTHFSRGLFTGKCNGNIAVRQASIFPGNEPRTNTKKLSNGKQKAHWYRGGNRSPYAIEEINNEIEHWRTSIIAAWRRVDLPAVCFNQYNGRGVAIFFLFL